MKLDNTYKFNTSPYEMLKSSFVNKGSSDVKENFENYFSSKTLNNNIINNVVPSENYTRYVPVTNRNTGAPYSHLATSWQGTTRYDDENRILYIGDRKETNNVLAIPYDLLSDEPNVINYNGTIFYCNNERRELYLGDMSKPDNVLTIPLSDGGRLMVNRDSITDLANAIGMFSPEDTKRILNAISTDTKAKKTKLDAEDIILKTYMSIAEH